MDSKEFCVEKKKNSQFVDQGVQVDVPLLVFAYFRMKTRLSKMFSDLSCTSCTGKKKKRQRMKKQKSAVEPLKTFGTVGTGETGAKTT